MNKSHIFTAQEMAFQEKDGTFYAVSLSFGLFAEGATCEEAFAELHAATLGYLIMCIADQESQEKIYRGAPEKYQKMYHTFLRQQQVQSIRPHRALARKSVAIQARGYPVLTRSQAIFA